MAGIANVTIKIGAETADAVRNIEKVNGALGDQMSASQKASSAISKAAVPAALAFAGVAAAAVDFTKAAAEDADAQAQLAGALKRTTGASDEAVAGAEKYIDSLSQQVAIADDELRPALAKLAGATGSVAKGQQQLALAADIAAQAHVPLATAVNAVVKADQGRYAGLQKLVPALDEATVKSKDQQAILDETAKLTAGAATEAAGTFAGQQKALQIQLGETEEAIGKGFLPVLQAVVPVLKKVADFAAENTTAIRVLMIAVGAVTGAILLANAAMKAYEAVSVIVKVATAAWTAVQWLLNAALNANPIGLVTIAIAALVAGIILAYKHSETFRNAIDDIWDAVKKYGIYLTPFGAAIAAVRLAWTAAQAVFESAIGHGPIDALKSVVLGLRDAFGDAKAALTTMVGYLAGAASGALGAFSTVIGGVSTAISTLIDWIQRLIGWLGKIKIPKGITGILSKIPGSPFSAAPPAAPARSRFAYASGANGRARGARAGALVAGAGGTTINVYGAVDPEGTARAIARLLAGHERRQGRSS